MGQDAIHPGSKIPTGGLEPAPSCEYRLLSFARLPSPSHWNLRLIQERIKSEPTAPLKETPARVMS
jgi:hypothetical protein